MPRKVLIGMDHANHFHETLEANQEELGYRLKSLQWKGGDWAAMEVAMEDAAEKKGVTFFAQQMPGCCAVLVISYMRIFGKDGEQATFDWALEIIERAAKDAAFGSVAMTQVVPKQGSWVREPWSLCLSPGREWIASNPFVNGKSGNHVVYLTKDLDQEGKMDGFEVPIYG